MCVGIIRSTSSISFENLLMILPMGVVSKKAMVDMRMCSSSSLCNFNHTFVILESKSGKVFVYYLNGWFQSAKGHYNYSRQNWDWLEYTQDSINSKVLVPNSCINTCLRVSSPNWEPKVSSYVETLKMIMLYSKLFSIKSYKEPWLIPEKVHKGW